MFKVSSPVSGKFSNYFDDPVKLLRGSLNSQIFGKFIMLQTTLYIYIIYHKFIEMYIFTVNYLI